VIRVIKVIKVKKKKNLLIVFQVIGYIMIQREREEKALKTPFLPPPYTTKKCQQFHEIVKAKKDPDSKWFTCTITIKGQTSKNVFIILLF